MILVCPTIFWVRCAVSWVEMKVDGDIRWILNPVNLARTAWKPFILHKPLSFDARSVRGVRSMRSIHSARTQRLRQQTRNSRILDRMRRKTRLEAVN